MNDKSSAGKHPCNWFCETTRAAKHFRLWYRIGSTKLWSGSFDNVSNVSFALFTSSKWAPQLSRDLTNSAEQDFASATKWRGVLPSSSRSVRSPPTLDRNSIVYKAEYTYIKFLIILRNCNLVTLIDGKIFMEKRPTVESFDEAMWSNDQPPVPRAPIFTRWYAVYIPIKNVIRSQSLPIYHDNIYIPF